MKLYIHIYINAYTQNHAHSGAQHVSGGPRDRHLRRGLLLVRERLCLKPQKKEKEGVGRKEKEGEGAARVLLTQTHRSSIILHGTDN
jgi:hypothetical protein